jgi:hypothetical protein
MAASLFLAVLVTDLVDFDAYHLRYVLLNASSPSSWSHHLTAIVIGAGAVASLIGAWREPKQRVLWAGAAAVLAFLFVDEVTSLHARVDSLSYGKLVYVPALLIVAICTWKVTTRSAHAATLRIALGLLVAAYGVHVFGPAAVHALGWGTDSWAFQIKVATKEGGELAGLALALWALAAAAVSAPARSVP